MSISVQTGDEISIIPAQGAIDILGNAWSLFRQNLRSSLLIVLIPVIFMCGWNILISLLTSQPSMTATTNAQLMRQGLIALLSLGFIIPMILAWIYSSCILSRFYYSRIVPGAPLDVRESERYVRRIALRLTAMVAVLIPMLVVLTVAGATLLVLGMSLSALVISALGGLFHGLPSSKHATSGIMMFFFLLAWGFTMLSLLIGLISLETYCYLFPLIAVSTARNSRSVSWMARLRLAFRHVFSRRFPRLTFFLLALFVFSIAINMALSSPVWVWAAVEMARMGPGELQQGALHVQVVLNIAASLAQMFVMPLTISAMTLFWYDCRVRREGLDLRLQLNGLLRRQGENLQPAIVPEAGMPTLPKPDILSE